MATFHYFDRFLRYHLGHYHDEAEQIAAVARAAGSTVRIYLPPDADARIVAAFAGAVLPLAVGNAAAGEDPIRHDAIRMEAAWRALGGEPFAAADVLYLASLRPGELVGIVRFLAALPADRRPRTVLRIYEPDDFVEPSGSVPSGMAALWRRAMAEIADLPVPLTLVSETATLARVATETLGRPVLAVPSPIPLDGAPPPATTPSAWEGRSSPRVLFVCHRRAIAVADLVACLRHIRVRRPDAALMVKLNDLKSIMHVREHAYLTGTLGIAVVLDFLPRAELTRLLAEADLLVLPYRLDTYRSRASGPFVMAAALARPVVVPAESWMAAEIAAGRGAGMVYRRDRPEIVAGATLAAIDRLERLTRKAASAATEALRTHGPRQFVERITDLVRSQPQPADGAGSPPT